MSEILNVVLLTDIGEGGVQILNRWLERTGLPVLSNVFSRTSKTVMNTNVYVAVWSGVVLSDITRQMNTIPWDHPKSVQLLISGRDDNKYYTLFGAVPHWGASHGE